MAELQSLNITDKAFPFEMAQTDGTLVYALEKLLWLIVMKSGYRITSI